ncbi:transposase [Candidatus Poriferisodalis sp.]|uniref:transposase n=1 Tax=Candidatus Poriferisodalis sp. TaxID=3101277 RepID=UPI003AF74184
MARQRDRPDDLPDPRPRTRRRDARRAVPRPARRSVPPEPNKLGRTPRTWRDQITNRHRSRVTNGPTGAANNPAKLTKRVSFGITNFDHYRIRALLHAAKPDRSLLDTFTPR